MKITTAVVAAVFVCASAGAAPPVLDEELDVEHWRELYANMVLVLLDDSSQVGDGEAIADQLTDLGATVPVVFDREAVIASVPQEAPLAAIAGPHVRSVHRQQVPLAFARGRHQAEAAVKYFNAARSGALLAQLIEIQHLPPMPLMNDVFSPGVGDSTSSSVVTEGIRFEPAPLWYGRNASMNGRIRSTLFYVQCQGAPECRFTWTQTAVDDVTNRIVNGYQFWSDVGQRYGKTITFTVVAYGPTYTSQVNVPVEPVLYPAAFRQGTNERNDSLWIDPIMANFGYGSGDEWARVRAYTGAILQGGYYSSAFCSFIANNEGGTIDYPTYGGLSGVGSYAYLGNFEVLLSNAFGRRDFVNLIAAHETGHVFWACDEYNSCSCQVCNNFAPDDRPPGNNAPNGNCVNGCGTSVGCIMKDNQVAFGPRQICTYTAQHVGWPAYACFNTVGVPNWSATYYNDVYDPSTGTYSHWTQGAVARYDEGGGFINHDWGSGSPSAGNCPVNSDRFSARYNRYVYFPEGTHTFTVTTDDGVLVMVDSSTVIDKQFDQPPTTYTGSIYLSNGTHLVKVYYYESTGGATLHVSWD
ncbi:MAG TPA: PA14 domain-containing protein [Thermoanaerobaculia bacterium]|jgi:hypothetical protein